MTAALPEKERMYFAKYQWYTTFYVIKFPKRPIFVKIGMGPNKGDFYFT